MCHAKKPTTIVLLSVMLNSLTLCQDKMVLMCHDKVLLSGMLIRVIWCGCSSLITLLLSC